ncbi:MAG: LysR family transcriptional regulator [Burkholderiales bacterium]
MISPERIDLKLLARFLAVVEHGSFAKAASAIDLTQQAVAYSITSLEEILGVTLFERVRQGVVPTQFGLRLTHHARDLLAEAKRTTESLQMLKLTTAGSVRVGVSEVLSAQVVPLALARLLGKYPEIEVTVREGPSWRMYELLEKGELDLMVGAPPTAIPLDDNVEQRLLFEDLDCVVMRAGHPLARSPAPDMADLQPLTWLVSRSREDSYEYLCESFLVAGLEPPRHIIRNDGLATGMNLLLLTDCVAFTSVWLAPQIMNEGAGGLFRAFHVRGLERKRRAVIRYIRNAALSRAAQSLITEIQLAANEVRGGGTPI